MLSPNVICPTCTEYNSTGVFFKFDQKSSKLDKSPFAIRVAIAIMEDFSIEFSHF